MAVPGRSWARDSRLVVLPLVGLFFGLLTALFVADLPPAPAAAAPPPALRPPPAQTPGHERRSQPPKPQARVARPTVVEIRSIDVRAKIRGVGLNQDGSMEVPPFGSAGWYRKGPKPGEPGSSVVVAHVDSYEGPDVFFRLHELRRGDTVMIHRADGSTGRWRVLTSEQTPKDELPVERIWNDTRRRVLRLVTCGGNFNEATGHYEDNITVYLAPVKV